MVQFYPGGRPKAVTGPPGQPLVIGHAQIVEPSPCPIGPAQMSAQSLALCAAAPPPSRSVDVQMDRYALAAGVVDRVCRNSAYGVVT
jgi:hypothetical protein